MITKQYQPIPSSAPTTSTAADATTMAAVASSTPSLVESLFQRSLDDLIKSLRSAPPSGEPAALSRALDEIRREIRSSDPDTKSVALAKLTYLSSLHHLDSSWAAFHALELLPSPSLLVKRAAYLTATLSFHPSTTPVLPLATHQLRKDLTASSSSPLSTALSLRLLSSAASPDLATHLSPELHALLSSSRPALRRQAIAASLPVLSLSPDSAALALPRLVDALSDPRAAHAAIGVFCELSAADPRPYLPLAPEFYRILVDSRSNWTLIKVLKIFARLAALEPRLARRIVDPISDHLRRSPAKSLLFECIRTVIISLADHTAALRLALDKLKEEFLTANDDPNLRFLGLHALAMLGPHHSWAVEENREVVIRSLVDRDPNIRREALHLVTSLMNENNVIEVSELLLSYAMKTEEPEFCNEILDAVLSTCGRNVYELVADFDWYVSLLGDMARNPHCAKGGEIGRQFVDIGLRVRDARSELVRVARGLLIDPAFLGNPLLLEVLSAAAWISGEYIKLSRNAVELVEALLQPRTNLLPMNARAVYIQAVFKVLSFCFSSYVKQMGAGQLSFFDDPIRGTPDGEAESEDDAVGSEKPASLLALVEKDTFTHESFVYVLNLIETSLAPLSDCTQVEVQERARNVLGLIHMLREVKEWDTRKEGIKEEERVSKLVKHMQAVFSEELGPVSLHAQKKVPLPEGLVLNENLADLTILFGGDDEIISYASPSFSLRSHHHKEKNPDATVSVESSSLLAEHRKRHGLYYLASEKGEAEINEYPRANEPQLTATYSDATEDIVKLTDQSLFPRKTKHTKPRPVVVKLEDGDGPSTSHLRPVEEPKSNLLSDVVRDVLSRNDEKSESSQKKYSDKSLRKRMKDVPVNSGSIPQLVENSDLVNKEHASSSSKSRHQNRSKERHINPHKNEQREEKLQMGSTRSGHRHRRHKHRERHGSLDVVQQVPVIQDFLL